MIDIENCGLHVQIISTDNYPININPLKLFSLNGKLETRVPHPFNHSRFLFLIFDFVHILKGIRNNWLNQKNFDKTMYSPNLISRLINVNAPFVSIQHLFKMYVFYTILKEQV